MLNSKQIFERVTRRHLFRQVGSGIGALALGSMLNPGAHASLLESSVNAHLQQPHFAPRAKNVIYIHMVGAPSQIDLFDPKPQLQKRDGQLCPDEFFEGKQLAFISEQQALLGTPKTKPFGFRACGKSGLEISNLLPNIQQVADELTLIRSMHTEQFNHAPAQLLMLSGFERFGRPSVGSWVSYGLGSENQNLPGFVVLITGQILGAGNSAWGSGFLPTIHQGIEFRSKGDPVLFLSNPKGVGQKNRKQMIDAINELNRKNLEITGDPEIETRIKQYELAFRMQTSVPELMDTKQEPENIHELYGTRPGQASFANNCLLARRLVERGVRFVQLFDQGWDMHGSIVSQLPKKCKQVDRPIAALIKDLKQRGLLDDTLVIWSSEFGRTPMGQGTDGNGNSTRVGRDHHKEAFTTFMAGGGGKSGFVYGKTDELGYDIVEDPMHVHDFNATLLHLLGMDHEQLTYRYQGRQYRLTDVKGIVADKIIA